MPSRTSRAADKISFFREMSASAMLDAPRRMSTDSDTHAHRGTHTHSKEIQVKNAIEDIGKEVRLYFVVTMIISEW